MSETIEILVHAPKGRGDIKRVQIVTLDDKCFTYEVWGCRRESDEMMTLFVIPSE
jgi:hypothetical protein